MNNETKRHREGGHFPSAARSRRLATAILALAIICPMFALAQVPPRFYWKSLAGANAVPVIFQSLSGNANPIDPAHVVSPDGSVDANVLVAGYAKMLPLFDRTLTLAVLEPMGRISGDTTVAGLTYNQDATGFGDPMVEVGINLIGPKAIRTIPDLLRYEPKFSLDLIVDVAFPIGEYDSDQPLNLGQNRWYGRVGAPIVWQIGPWVPGRRTTLEVLPSVWFFSDNNDYVGQTLSTDPMFQVEGAFDPRLHGTFLGFARLDLDGWRQVERGWSQRRFAEQPGRRFHARLPDQRQPLPHRRLHGDRQRQ